MPLNLDAVGGDGRTALHTAAANGHRAVVRALADAGCDIDGAPPTARPPPNARGRPLCNLRGPDGGGAKRDQIWRAINGEATIAAAVTGGAQGQEAPF